MLIFKKPHHFQQTMSYVSRCICWFVLKRCLLFFLWQVGKAQIYEKVIFIDTFWLCNNLKKYFSLAIHFYLDDCLLTLWNILYFEILCYMKCWRKRKIVTDILNELEEACDSLLEEVEAICGCVGARVARSNCFWMRLISMYRLSIQPLFHLL